MPTASFFDQFPPFPEDLAVYELPQLSYAKLRDNDPSESEALLEASCDEGFFFLDLSQGSGGQELLRDVETAFRIGRSFFDADLETKKEYKLQHNNVGYKEVGLIKHGDGTADLTEICAVSRDALYDSQIWLPKAYADQRALLESVARRLHEVSMTIISHLATHFHIPPSVFRAQHEPSDPSATVLRFLHNLHQTQSSQTSLLGHTDNGSLTVLFTTLGGLQILPASAAEAPANWRWVRPLPGGAVVNIGDALVQWTGGVLRSGFHRVLYAPGEQGACDRYSLGYFLKPADEAPMRRIRGGRVPALKADEEGEDGKVPSYKDWHRVKSKGIKQGLNNTDRGGRGFAQLAKIAA